MKSTSIPNHIGISTYILCMIMLIMFVITCILEKMPYQATIFNIYTASIYAFILESSLGIVLRNLHYFLFFNLIAQATLLYFGRGTKNITYKSIVMIIIWFICILWLMNDV